MSSKITFAILLVLIIYSCQKDGTSIKAPLEARISVQDVQKAFSQSLKKNSTSAEPVAFRIPDWEKSWSRGLKNGKNVLSIPLSSKKEDRLNGSRSRLVAYKDEHGNIIMKVMEIIPDEAYLKRYKGRLDTRTYTGDILFFDLTHHFDSGYILENGKVVGGIKLGNDEGLKLKKAGGMKVKSNDIECEWRESRRYWDGEGVFHIVFKNYCRTFFKPDESLPSEEDEAPSGGGGGGGSGGYYGPEWEEEEQAESFEITNIITDSCMKAMVDTVIAKNLHFSVNQSLQSIFNTSDHINLEFAQTPLDTLTDGVTAIRQPMFSPDGSYEYLTVDVYLNSITMPHSSQEYIAATAIHEALHGYFRYKYPSGGNPANGTLDHYNMTTNYMAFFKSSLKSLFPLMDDDDIFALSWGGLQQEPGYAALTSVQKDFVNSVNKKYKKGIYGQKCN